MYLLVARQLVIMLLIATAGFCVSKFFKFGNREQKFVSKTLLYFVNPALIITKFNGQTFQVQLLENLGIMVLVSFVAHVALTVVALVFVRSKNAEAKELDAIDRLGIVFTNCAFIGIPLIEGAFGDLPNNGGQNAIFYLLGYVIVFNIYLWTFGIKMFGGKINFLKVITNPNIVSVIAGVCLFCAPFELPQIIAKPVEYIGEMTVGMSMLLLGMLFANYGKSEEPENALENNCLKSSFDDDSSSAVKNKKTGKKYFGRVAKVCLLRCIVSPCFAFLFVLLFAKVFGWVEDIRLMSYVILICVLCPIGMSVSSFAVLFNKDESYSGLTVLATSALCVVTIPAAIAAAEMIY